MEANASGKNAVHLALYDWLGCYFKGGRIVDLGSELGFGLRRLVRRDRMVIGMDFHLDALMISNTDDGEGRRINHLCSDGESIPLPTASIDGLCMVNVLHLVKNPRRVLEESWRILSPGSELVVCVPTDINLPDRWRVPSEISFFRMILHSVFEKVQLLHERNTGQDPSLVLPCQLLRSGLLTAVCTRT
mgnify:CR=1 FL=1